MHRNNKLGNNLRKPKNSLNFRVGQFYFGSKVSKNNLMQKKAWVCRGQNCRSCMFGKKTSYTKMWKYSAWIYVGGEKSEEWFSVPAESESPRKL